MNPIRRFKIETLVRDKMPEHIQKLGGHVKLYPLDANETLSHLKLKLHEEIAEVCHATTRQEVSEEIGDILEVLYALSKKYALRWEDIERARLQKQALRGGFEGGTYVKYVEVNAEEDSHPLVAYYLSNSDKYPEILEKIL